MSESSADAASSTPAASTRPPMPSTQPPTPSTPPHAPAVQPAGVGQLPPTAPTAWDLAALAGALRDEKGGLAFLGVAGRYFAANQRMLLFRNSLIAVCGVVLLLLGIAVCWHEAHRQTMSITAFDVPKSLEVRGITGQVVAKALFDELIRRRALVTTLDSGDLKGAWADNRADVAIPQTGFSVQSLFRYLRSMTGHEISVDGEIMLDGDDAVVKVRVAGHAPTVAKGKIAQWEGLMGDLAGGVLGIAQPAVQAAYLGLKAQTPDDLAALSKHLRQMEQASPPPSAAVLSVGYDAYGSALLRQGRTPDALLAFGEAMTLDPANGVAVVNAANVQADQRNYKEANALFTRAQSLALPDTVKVNALRRRITGATNPGDCVAAAAFIQDARASPLYTARLFVDREATFTLLCEFEEQRAVDMLAPYVALHPTDAAFTNTLGLILQRRPEGRYREQAIQVFRDAIAAGVDSPLIYGNLARNLLESGRFEEGAEATRQVLRLLGDPALRERVRDRNMAIAYHHRQEYAKADEIFTRLALKVPLKEVQNISDLAFVKMSLGHFDEAIAVYDAGLALLPKSCNLWQELGLAYAARGKPGDIDTALATFDKGITAVPKCGLTYNAAARLLIKAGRLPEARKKLDALIKIAPKSDGAVIAKEILASVAGKG